LACPFFMPVKRLEEDGTWLHPARLPLKGGWDGHCCAPGHEGAVLAREDLRECNLGYAVNCSRLPHERTSDAIRFSVAQDASEKLILFFVRELNHHPVEHGTLEYDLASAQWKSSHGDVRVQKMAECYVEMYLQCRALSATA
jgi:hypothetical protein